MTSVFGFGAFLKLVSFTLLFTVFAAQAEKIECRDCDVPFEIRNVEKGLVEVRMRVEVDPFSHNKFEAADLVKRIVRNDLGQMTSFKVLRDSEIRREGAFGELESEGYIEESWFIVFRLRDPKISGKKLNTLIERLENARGGYCVPLLSSAKTLVSAPERGGRLPPIDPTGM